MALATFSEKLFQASTSLDMIKAWLSGSVGKDSLPSKPRISDVDRLAIDNDDTTSGVPLTVKSDVTTGGPVVDISVAALTTATALDISNLDAITTGRGIYIDATGVTHTTGILFEVDSASTALTGAGRLLLVDSTGDFNDTTGIVAEIKTVHTTGIGLLLTMDAVTDGFALDLTVDALTTGNAVRIQSAATAITGAGRLLLVEHTGATTTTGIIAEIVSAATDETALLRLKSGGTGIDLEIINTETGALGPKIELYHNVGNSQAADNDVVGRLRFQADDEEASATKTLVGQMDCLWTDATAASYASRFIFYTSTGGAQNEALRILDDGSLSIDLSSGAGTALVFDDYDDAKVLETVSSGYDKMVETLSDMGIMELKECGRGHYLHLQGFLMLLAGGIYQTRQRLDDKVRDLEAQIYKLQMAS